MENPPPTIGLLISGGLDSSILLGHLLQQGRTVQPFYVQSGLVWQREELWALKALLIALNDDRLRPLVELEMPLADLYGMHWSITGRDVPDARTADEAVYLPGRNLLLAVKPAIWCRMHGIEELALAVLGSSPFGDATDEFFRQFESLLRTATDGGPRLVRPFGTMSKREVMQLGRSLPLELTFSCINPQRGLHCGVCNKCRERRQAFGLAGMADPTRYAEG
ncbi:MAG: 7-cyano-7-deazaguanine synthase [Pirellulales bacterium]|nr:7-cyano-7-deazaguanine synthase [Pirellulales bacterium]